MNIELEIKEHLTQLEQMAAQTGISTINDQITIPSFLGSGFCRLYRLPYQVQLHHYSFCLNQQVQVNSINNIDDGMYIININLSQKLVNKSIGDTEQWLSREGENGVLFYSPGNNSSGNNEIDLLFEMIFFSIPKATFDQFLKSINLSHCDLENSFCYYAEVDDVIRNDLLSILNPKTDLNLFSLHGKIFEILGRILSLFYQEEWESKKSGLKIKDIETLLKVQDTLRSHIFGTPPKIDELARQSNMSASQLKSKFKSLFGNSIYRYYLESKLKIANKLLLAGDGTISEIGFRLGYSNISQFSAQFKKQYGVLPSKVKG